MSAVNMGLPEWEAGDRHSRPPATDTFHKVNNHHHHAAAATSLYRYADGLRRRRSAADKLPPLACGRRDKWSYPPPGQRGYEQAALHLLERGLLPAANREGLQVMRDRQAAEFIAEAWGLVA